LILLEQHPQPAPCADDRTGSCAARSLIACAERVVPESEDNNGALRITRIASASHTGQLAGASRRAMERIASNGPQLAHSNS
jgi:hypothetical protein